MARKKITPIRKDQSILIKYPPGYFFGSIVLGIFVTILFTPLIVGTMMLIQLDSFTLTEFIIFKSIWGALMAAFWAPIFALIALNEAKNIEKAPDSIWMVIRNFCR